MPKEHPELDLHIQKGTDFNAHLQILSNSLFSPFLIAQPRPFCNSLISFKKLHSGNKMAICYLLITFANRLDQEQAISRLLDNLIVFLEMVFEKKKSILKNASDDKKQKQSKLNSI